MRFTGQSTTYGRARREYVGVHNNYGEIMQMLKPNVANIPLFNFCEQKFVLHDPITKKTGPIMPLDQNPHQTVTVLGASAFQCMREGFLCPKCDNFACLHTRQGQNKLHLKRWFFVKISIFCKLIAGPLSEACTQLHSFGGRIQLIICQIRHVHSRNKHELKKTDRRTEERKATFRVII